MRQGTAEKRSTGKHKICAAIQLLEICPGFGMKPASLTLAAIPSALARRADINGAPHRDDLVVGHFELADCARTPPALDVS